jgi:hypothetical protein
VHRDDVLGEVDRGLQPERNSYAKLHRINALPPKGIDKKSAHIIGGGVAGLGNH